MLVSHIIANAKFGVKTYCSKRNSDCDALSAGRQLLQCSVYSGNRYYFDSRIPSENVTSFKYNQTHTP